MHHGMLTVYKEAGYTSSDAVARLRGILKMRKIGHTGTLDPDAEGVLPMCLGNATRICELIADREKEYRAVMRLGVRTDTQDMSGTVLSRTDQGLLRDLILAGAGDRGDKGPAGHSPAAAGEGDPDADPVQEAIRRACAAFVGEIDQIPPMYSAVKVNGKRLYDMARKGIVVERKPRRITIYSLLVEKVDLPLVTLKVRCSKGTYIRTLCEDIGNALGTGAAMQSLLRTRVGSFTLEEARRLDEIESMAKKDPARLPELIRPVDSFFSDLPAAECRAEAVRLLKNGNVLTAGQLRILTPQEDPLSRQMPDTGGSASPARTSPVQEPARQAQIPCPPSLPGITQEETVIRMYDPEGRFYGLYRGGKRQGEPKRYSAYKMFLPGDQG